MSPIGRFHAACVNRLVRVLTRELGDRAIVAVQNPVELDDYSEPQPDIALLEPRPDFYASGHPKPADIFLVIEVADSTIKGDRAKRIPCGNREIKIPQKPGFYEKCRADPPAPP